MLDQVAFMTSMLEIDGLQERVEKYLLRDLGLSNAESAIAKDVLVRGEVARGEAARITGLSERAARDALARLLNAVLLASATPKGPVSLRISTTAAQALFPRLF
jgi:Fic family protein